MHMDMDNIPLTHPWLVKREELLSRLALTFRFGRWARGKVRASDLGEENDWLDDLNVEAEANEASSSTWGSVPAFDMTYLRVSNVFYMRHDLFTC